MLRLRVVAPFAAFRPFAAGAYRRTAPFITPSAAYGLLLNIAGIETRRDDGTSPATVTAFGLPTVEVALAAIRVPTTQSLYQQLHNYPIGASTATADVPKGQKPNIQPIRREYLANLDAYVCIRGNNELEDRVRAGLHEGARFAPDGQVRYGLPFLGDNSFTLSQLREEAEGVSAWWFVLAQREDGTRIPNPCRLTVWIDRADSSRSVTRLYSRASVAQREVPDNAWTLIKPPGGEL